MLVVSICRLSPVILSVLCLRLDGGLDETGNCALLHKDNSTEQIISDIGRKSLNSSSFNLKIVKFVLFIALNLSTAVNSWKKRLIRHNAYEKNGINAHYPDFFRQQVSSDPVISEYGQTLISSNNKI